MTLCPTESDLLRWVDGDLSDRSAAEVATHLTECADCRTLLARSEAALRAALGGLADADVAVDAARPVQSSRFAFRRAAMAAAILVAVAVGFAAARALTSADDTSRSDRASIERSALRPIDPAVEVRALLADAQRLLSASEEDRATDPSATAALAAAEARIALGMDTGVARLHDVVEQFPGTPEAREARARIASLGGVR